MTSSSRPFRRAIGVTVTLLIVLVGVFAGLNYFHGPKLASGSVDLERVVLQSGQQLRLFANQNISTVRKRQVTVTPATPFTVNSSGKVIAVQFTHRLLYGTKYTVRARAVGNAVQPGTTEFRYSFVTAPAQIYYLDRADPASTGRQVDRIIKTGLRTEKRTVVYSAPHIDQFVALPGAVAFTTLGDDGTTSLSLVSDRDSSIVEHFLLPGSGTIDQLQVAPEGGVLGFVFTSSGPATDAQYPGILMTINLTGAHTAVPALDLAKKPLAVTGWSFIAGSADIVAQSMDQTVLRINPLTPGADIPLGQYQGLGRSAPDGKSIVVSDAFGSLAYSLDTGKETRLPSPPIAGARTFGGTTALVGPGTTRVRQVTTLDPSDRGRYTSSIVLEQGDHTRVLYQPTGRNASIEGFSVSPNGQYLAVNVIPDYGTSISDGYLNGAQSTSITTIFIDIATGSLVSGVAGFDESWR
ncbi:hypothetical protein F1C58_04090 [Glaciihabitans sp. INWT7]|uniref:hypothetical protein n=1 Tax=Glaciihabitans sp. INWT7 TaxID=2596912 RepID=UPI0016235901|nr:hypothetical protein [Glaciihabitans sp. INWT7]QNE46171.1 hypothetical protein F1C58_04090 [Glaciihabitans sp. INWT7]